ncbi:MAG: substrate-binding domain-containing protein [Desulfobacterales bacterium]|nr:substrate-binding domain-containing protein [Desulfobacterales bacterium]MBS3756327.1 substrate-binding domain-containing protein [Desulfobacterales bacterium]
MSSFRLYAALFFLTFCLMFPAAAPGQSLMMATTTSTDNTGLLDELAPKFKQDTGITLKWTAVGTGKALEIGRNCDVEVLMVHAPAAEKQFVNNGYGVERTQVMYNDFVIIGPDRDPAGIRGMDTKTAIKQMADEKGLFVSRGDDSGTNKKERALWDEAGVNPPARAKWYLETGQGMISTIRVAAERDGYTLTDRGTYIKYEHSQGGPVPLKILVQGDPALFNQYSAIAVNPDRCENVDYELAQKFINWITSGQIQAFIGNYKLLGKQLFTPNAGN